MKYTITILAILLLTSCKKEYKCTCKDKDANVVSTSSYKAKKSEKDDYKQKCFGEKAYYDGLNTSKSPHDCIFE